MWVGVRGRDKDVWVGVRVRGLGVVEMGRERIQDVWERGDGVGVWEKLGKGVGVWERGRKGVFRRGGGEVCVGCVRGGEV